MKGGIYWFLHLNKVLYGAEIALVIGIVAILFLPFGTPLYFLCIGVSILSFVIIVFLFAIQTPRDKHMEAFIEDAETGFEERHKRNFTEKHRQVKFYKLRCYAKSTAVRHGRMLHNRIVYANLVLVGLVTALDGKWLICETTCLLRKSDRETVTYRIDDANSIQVEKTPEDYENCKLVIRGGDVVLELHTHDDYHVRDFLEVLKQPVGQ